MGVIIKTKSGDIKKSDSVLETAMFLKDLYSVPTTFYFNTSDIEAELGHVLTRREIQNALSYLVDVSYGMVVSEGRNEWALTRTWLSRS